MLHMKNAQFQFFSVVYINHFEASCVTVTLCHVSFTSKSLLIVGNLTYEFLDCITYSKAPNMNLMWES
jgi:hypothetical protein